MGIDFMGVMRYCVRCKSSDDDVTWSKQWDCYCCDDCYEEMFRDADNLCIATNNYKTNLK